MYQTYTKKIQIIEEDVSKIIESAFALFENSGEVKTYNTHVSYVKIKEIKCTLYMKYVKLDAITKITYDNVIEYKIRGFQVKSRSYYNYSLNMIPFEIKAQLADYLMERVKLPKFTILSVTV